MDMSNPFLQLGAVAVQPGAPPPTNPFETLGAIRVQPEQARVPVGALESIQAGWQAGVPGLAWRRRLPDLVMGPSLNKWWERALTGITQVATELPLMIPAAMAGSVAGAAGGAAVTGPAAPAGAAVGGLLGAGAAMFAVPGTIRESLMQAYKPGGLQTSEDWWRAIRSVAMTSLKEAGIGAATFGVGGVARGAASAAMGASREAATAIGMGTARAIGPTAKVAGVSDIAGQIVAMTSLPAALQGRLPEAQEFMDAAIVIGGLKAAHVTATRMMNVYSRTGKTPIEQVAEANAKPEIKEDLVKPPEPPVDVLAPGAPRFPDQMRVQEQMFAEVALRDAARAGKPVEGEAPSPDLPATELLMAAKSEAGKPEQPWTEAVVRKLGDVTDVDRPAIFRMLFPEIAKVETEPKTPREAGIWRETRGEVGAAGKMEFPNLGEALKTFERPLSEKQQAEFDLRDARIKAMEQKLRDLGAFEDSARRLEEQYFRQLREVNDARVNSGREPLYDEATTRQVAAMYVRSVVTRAKRLDKSIEEVYGENFGSVRSGFWMGDERLDVPRFRGGLEELAKERKAGMPPAGEPLATLIGDLRALGGISTNEMKSLGGERYAGTLFRKKAYELDELVTQLNESPYNWGIFESERLSATETLAEMIRNEFASPGTNVRPEQAGLIGAMKERSQAASEVDAVRKALNGERMSPEEEAVVKEWLDMIEQRAKPEEKAAIAEEIAATPGARLKSEEAAAKDVFERDASPEIKDAVEKGELESSSAFAIASAAPGDAELQAIGRNAAVNTGGNVLLAVNLMRVSGVLRKEGRAFDDATRAEADQLADALTQKQAFIAELIENTEFEASKGDLLAARDLVDLKVERQRWEARDLDPQYLQQLRDDMQSLKQGPIEVKPDILKTGPGTYVVGLNGKEIGRANLAKKPDGTYDNYFVSVRIDPEFRRQGVASRLYDFVQADTGQPLRPSPRFQTPDAKAFWEARLADEVRAGQEAFALRGQTPAEVDARNREAIAQARRQLLDERNAKRKAKGLEPIGDQADLFNTQGALFQRQGGLLTPEQNRAAYDRATKTVTLFKTADPTSLLHEWSHDWLEELREDAGRRDAPQQIKDDWNMASAWLGIDSNPGVPITTKAHETWAKAGELYFMEGRAPSLGLKAIFEKAVQWMVDTYKTFAGLGADINDNIRAVFDRKLAMDDEIAAARAMDVPREYVAEAKAVKAAEIVKTPEEPGFKEEILSIYPFSEQELLMGPGSGREWNSRVNPSTVNGPMDVMLGLQRMAEIDQDAIQSRRGGKGGVMSGEERDARVDDLMLNTLGGDINAFLAEANREGRIPHNVMQRAALKFLMQLESESLAMRDQVLRLGYDTPVGVGLEYLKSILRARVTHQTFLGLRAEAARAQRDLQDAVSVGERLGALEDAVIVEPLRQGPAEGGRLFQSPADVIARQEQVKAELDAIMLKYFKGKAPFDVAKLHREIGDSLKAHLGFDKAVTEAGTWEKLIEGWKAWGLLSGPVTHTTNFFGTQGFMAFRPLVDTLAATIGMARGARVGTGETDRASMSEGVARILGTLKGVASALRVGYHVFRQDEPSGKFESYRNAIPGAFGQVVRIPFRLMGAEDAINQTMYYRGELETLALRQAFSENLNPNSAEFSARVNFLIDNPDFRPEGVGKTIGQISDEASRRMAFNAPLGEKGVSLQLLVEKWNLQWMMPFVRTPINIAKEVARMTPLAPMVGEWRADIAKGGVAKDRAIAEAVLGSGIMAIIMAYTFSGDISGSGSPDPGKNRGKTGVWQGYSVLVGDTWYEYARIQPLGTVVGLAADLATAWEYMTDDEKDKVPKLLARAFANAVTNQTFLSGISNVVNAMSDPVRFGPRFIQGMAGTLVPNIIGQTTTMADPYVRDARSALEAIQARVPGWREQLFPKRDWLGAPLETKERLGVVLPVRTQEISEDKVRLEAARLDISIGMPKKTLHLGKGTGKIGNIELTAEEHNNLQKVGGEMAHQILTQVVNAPGYDQMPPMIQKKMFANVLRSTRQVAAATALPMEKRLAYIQDIVEELGAAMQPEQAQ